MSILRSPIFLFGNLASFWCPIALSPGKITCVFAGPSLALAVSQRGAIYLTGLESYATYPEVRAVTVTGLATIPESYISEATRWTWPTFTDVG